MIGIGYNFLKKDLNNIKNLKTQLYILIKIGLIKIQNMKYFLIKINIII